MIVIGDAIRECLNGRSMMKSFLSRSLTGLGAMCLMLSFVGLSVNTAFASTTKVDCPASAGCTGQSATNCGGNTSCTGGESCACCKKTDAEVCHCI